MVLRALDEHNLKEQNPFFFHATGNLFFIKFKVLGVKLSFHRFKWNIIESELFFINISVQWFGEILDNLVTIG